MESSGFSIYKIVSSENSGSFTSPFPVLKPFIAFSCLIALAKTCNTMLNEWQEWATLSCSWCYRDSFQFFTIECNTSCEFVMYEFYYVEVHSFYMHFIESFFLNHKWVYSLVKCFSCIYWDDCMVFILPFVNVIYHVDHFADVESFFTSLIMVCNPFNILLYLVW